MVSTPCLQQEPPTSPLTLLRLWWMSNSVSLAHGKHGRGWEGAVGKVAGEFYLMPSEFERVVLFLYLLKLRHTLSLTVPILSSTKGQILNLTIPCTLPLSLPAPNPCPLAVEMSPWVRVCLCSYHLSVCVAWMKVSFLGHAYHLSSKRPVCSRYQLDSEPMRGRSQHVC